MTQVFVQRVVGFIIANNRFAYRYVHTSVQRSTPRSGKGSIVFQDKYAKILLIQVSERWPGWQTFSIYSEARMSNVEITPSRQTTHEHNCQNCIILTAIICASTSEPSSARANEGDKMTIIAPELVLAWAVRQSK